MQLRPDDKVLDLATGTADVPWASRDMGHERTGCFKKQATGKREGLKIQGISDITDIYKPMEYGEFSASHVYPRAPKIC